MNNGKAKVDDRHNEKKDNKMRNGYAENGEKGVGADKLEGGWRGGGKEEREGQRREG